MPCYDSAPQGASMKTRRNFLKHIAVLYGYAGSSLICPELLFATDKSSTMKLGLVTYQWGMDLGPADR